MVLNGIRFLSMLGTLGTVEQKEVWNEPPDFTPVKKDTQADPSISIDGKTALLGDRIYYRVTIDAKQTNQAYKVWRLGMTDDWDDEYLSRHPKVRVRHVREVAGGQPAD